MAYFQDTSNNLYYLSDQDIANGGMALLPSDATSITDDQVMALKAPTLAQAQVTQIQSLSMACQSAISMGFSSTALGSVHTYPAKDTDQQNLSASILASLLPGLPNTWTTPFWCEDSNGNWALLPHTVAQIQQVGQDGKAAILANIEKNAGLAAQVSAATSIAAVQAIIWS